MENVLATSKQRACIEGMSKRVGVELDLDFKRLTKEEASVEIDELYAALQNKPKSRKVTYEETDANLNGLRLGMCIKLVYQKWIYRQDDVNVNKDEFKREVMQLYNIVAHLDGGA